MIVWKSNLSLHLYVAVQRFFCKDIYRKRRIALSYPALFSHKSILNRMQDISDINYWVFHPVVGLFNWSIRVSTCLMQNYLTLCSSTYSYFVLRFIFKCL